MQRRPSLSLNEWAVLGVIVDQPRHGYDVAAELTPGNALGDVWRLSRQLVYRALDRLDALGLADARRTEPGDAAPTRTVYGSTPRGRTELRSWLDTPVEHLRDVRGAFLLKLVLNDRLGRDRSTLVTAQREAFADLIDALACRPSTDDVIGAWRHHSARAVQIFLDGL